MTRNRIEQHPAEYRADLNPDYEAEENHGPPRYATRTAHDFKEVHERLSALRDDELKQIPVLEAGARLEHGATYFDLRHPESGTFQAAGGMVAGPLNWFVSKSDVDYQLWNLVTGVDNWDRLGSLVGEAADESEREPGAVG